MGSVPDNGETYVDQGIGVEDRLERLWAPYRMAYIKKDPVDDARGSTNPFVRIPEMSDEDGLIIARGEYVYCLLNLFPYNSGHMMVVPYRQEPNLEDLTAEEISELFAFGQAAIKVVKSVSHPDAINVGFNLGRASGGSVGEHLHMHIVPRWSGDANFMTVIDGTKVLPQLLRQTRSLLAQAWNEMDGIPGVAHA